MKLSDYSIKNPVFAWMLMLGLILFGAISFNRLGVSQMPDVDFPIVTVMMEYDGAAPEVMEMDVVDIIEDAVMSVQGIKKITSTAKNETANIIIEFDLDTNIENAVQEVQSKVAQAQSFLPSGMETPTVVKNNPEDQPIMWLAVSGTWESRKIMEFARDRLKPQFQTVSGVSEIFLGGYIEPNLRVWIDPEKLNQYQLTVEDVLDSIEREHVEVPAGRLENETSEYNLRFYGEALSPEQFENILILRRGGQSVFTPIRLGQVAHVVPGLDDIRRISRTNGNSAVGIGIKKQRGTNAVEIAARVRKKMEQIQKDLPEGLKIGVNFDGTKYIEESVHELNFTMVLSALLTAVVCLFFLGSVKSAFNIVLAIPTSIVGAFSVMYFLGYTLNTFTLLGLILAIGIVVDDAIMVLENIIRHQELGKSRLKAAIDGAREIAPAAFATTLAIIAIFMPILFMSGIVGKFLFQFGVVISATVALSLVEALTLTPMRAASFVSAANHENAFVKAVDGFFTRLSTQYKNILQWCLEHRFIVFVVAFMIFAASLVTATLVRKEFVPSQDRGNFLVRLQTPMGSSVHFTDNKMREVEALLTKQKSVSHYYLAVGGFGGGDVNIAMLFVTLKERKIRSQGQFEVMDELRASFSKIKDVRAFVQDLSASAFSAQRGFPIEFSVRGPDWEKLATYSEQIMEKMKADKTGELSTFTDVDTNYLFGQPEMQFLPDREKAHARGVSLAAIGRTIGSLIGGARSGKFSENGRRNDIRVKVEAGRVEANSQTLLDGIFVRNNRGELVSLNEVVTVRERKTLQSITREDRERAIGIFSNMGTGVDQSKAIDRVRSIAKTVLPEGYRIELSGAAATYSESNSGLLFVLLMGIVVAYMILGSQYNSFVHPITVLLALPFSVSGAFFALWLTNNSLNIYSYIGLVLLMGIVKKNSIMLVDFTNQQRATGLNVRDSILTACPIRLRPILMTSFATIAGAIPPALSLGPGAETNIPMSVVVIGGVFVSTFLTLIVVPCAYSAFSRFERMPLDHGAIVEREMSSPV